MNNVLIRLEQPGDQCAVEALTRDAFWDVYKPGCDEHLVAHRLRTHPDFIPELDFVALSGDKIVGNIMYSRAAIVQPDSTRFPIVIFGPLSVHPDYQRQGVGAALVRHSLEQAKALGFAGVALTGSPDYYPRFGFRPGRGFGITDAEGEQLRLSDGNAACSGHPARGRAHRERGVLLHHARRRGGV
ncbi:MAG: N-acetyltransferase [Clostridiaceae bacterium]|nr:N-acetyltransferase [Clostridiaceae bacterium]